MSDEDDITMTSLCDRLGVSPVTARDWIAAWNKDCKEDEQIQVIQDKYRASRKIISHADAEKLALAHGRRIRPIPPVLPKTLASVLDMIYILQSQVKELEQENTSLRSQIDELEAEKRARDAHLTRYTSQETPRPARHTAQVGDRASDTIPDGYMSVGRFCSVYPAMPSTTLDWQITQGKYPAEIGKWIERGHLVKKILSPETQALILHEKGIQANQQEAGEA